MVCRRCGVREATETWCESALAFAHGLTQQWCQRCVVVEQLAHARKSAEQIPMLEARLNDLT